MASQIQPARVIARDKAGLSGAAALQAAKAVTARAVWEEAEQRSADAFAEARADVFGTLREWVKRAA